MADKTPPDAQGEPTFEQALERLELIVHELEEGQISLADGLARYEEGVKLLKQCYQSLEGVGRRIELLSRVDSEGVAECEPFDEGDLSVDEKAKKRSRRRSRPAEGDPPRAEDEIDGPRSLF